jgi:hypothetical protein
MKPTAKPFAILAGLLLGYAASLLAAPLPLPYPAPLPPPQAAAGFTADKGKFRIMQQGAELGSEDFDLTPAGGGWVAHGDATIRVPGSGSTRSTGTLRLAADGSPLHYDWSAQAQKKSSGSVAFENGTAKSSITLEGKDAVHQDFKFTSPRIAVLDNNLYDQYGLLGRLYNWNAKGAQTFPVVIPQDMTPGSVTVESLGPKTAGGAQLEALQFRSADLEIILYFDAKHRLMRLEVPAAMVVVVRQ